MSALPDTDALAKLLAEATPGPWFKHGNGQQIMSKARLIATMPYGAQSKPDSRLIALAPALAAQRIADAARIAELEAENADLKTSVVAFGGMWATIYGRQIGLPDGTITATHYDLIARAGGRMSDFKRAE